MEPKLVLFMTLILYRVAKTTTRTPSSVETATTTADKPNQQQQQQNERFYIFHCRTAYSMHIRDCLDDFIGNLRIEHGERNRRKENVRMEIGKCTPQYY